MRYLTLGVVACCLTLSGCGGGGTAPVTTLIVSVPVTSITSGTSVQASATVNGSPATNVTWSSSNSNIAGVSSTGLITGTLKGPATITAHANGSTGQVDVTVVPGAPASVVIYSGNGQTAAKGTVLADPLCTNVLDAAGNLIIGTTVTYTVLTGGGTIGSPTSPATDANGVAISGLWTLGPNAGQQSVKASISVGSVTFTANAQ